MLSLLLLLPLAVCNSTFTCSVACEKDDVAACTWLAHELDDQQAAARACALDDTACDELARIILARGRPQDIDDAAARLAPRCEKGDLTMCEAILKRAWGGLLRDHASPSPFALSTRAASRAYCSAAAPSVCPSDGEFCQDWTRPLELCAAAAAGLNEQKLIESVWTRAIAACRKDANACVDVLFHAREKLSAATTPQEKAQLTKTFVEVVQATVPACRKPNDRACRSLNTLELDDVPSVAKVVTTKLCAVEGGRVCSEQHVRLCEGGKGPLSACIDAVLGIGTDSFDGDGGVSKKLMEACIKDDPRACFASGVVSVGHRYSRLRDSVLTADEAFAKACKLKHKGACRATVKPEAIVEPRAIPADALHPSEQVSVYVRAKGDGAAIGNVFLIEEWTWSLGGDGEADHDRSMVAVEEGAFGMRRERLELGGLKEGADVIVWNSTAGTVTRTVVIANVGP